VKRQGRPLRAVRENGTQMESHGMDSQNSSMVVLIHYPFAGRLGEAVPAIAASGRDGLSEPSVRMESHGMIFQNSSMAVIVHYLFAGQLRITVPAQSHPCRIFCIALPRIRSLP
jgi:hypothetical protein